MVSKVADPSARIDKLFKKLNRLVSRSSSMASPEAVHDLRTTSRRIETLLSSHGMDHGGAAKLARQVAKLRRRAGKLRDIDVHIAALTGIRLEDGGRDKGVLQDHLTKLRGKREAKLVRTVEKELSKGVLKRLKRASKELTAQGHDSQPKEHTAQALSRFKALTEQSPQLTERTLHDFRISCKHIRYLAEMSGDAADTERVVTLLKEIQDAIGDWHDWLTLTEVAKEVLGHSASGLIAALRTETKSKFNEAIHVTGRATQSLLELQSNIEPPERVPQPGPAGTRQNGSGRSVRASSTARKTTVIAA